jgi:hypothetical protein
VTHRVYLKCDVCGSIILTRTQIGHLEEHPIRIHCAKCGILISGEFHQNPDVPQFTMSFENATVIPMQDPDYYIEISGEFLTEKIRPFDKSEDVFQLPPFFKSMYSMGGFIESGDENAFSKFANNYMEFLGFIKKDWPYIRRIHELWISGNHNYLAQQMRDHLSPDIFPLNNNLEYLRGIHQLFLLGFRSALPSNFYQETTHAIWNGTNEVATANLAGYKALTEFFNDNGYFEQYEKRVLKILNGFVEKYPFFITALGLENYATKPDLVRSGTTTVSFEDVKYYYLECFEAIGEIMALVVAYNNLKYRNDCFKMANSSFKTVKTLQDFISMRNKGNKLLFCTNSESFYNLMGLEADNDLRNAIGHDSYTYDGVNQVISYFSSGQLGKGDVQTIYLIEFIQKTINLFYVLVALIELLYQTRKYYYILHGITPISPEMLNNLQRKIGRNEPCPCGSKRNVVVSTNNIRLKTRLNLGGFSYAQNSERSMKWNRKRCMSSRKRPMRTILTRKSISTSCRII